MKWERKTGLERGRIWAAMQFQQWPQPISGNLSASVTQIGVNSLGLYILTLASDWIWLPRVSLFSWFCKGLRAKYFLPTAVSFTFLLKDFGYNITDDLLDLHSQRLAIFCIFCGKGEGKYKGEITSHFLSGSQGTKGVSQNPNIL